MDPGYAPTGPTALREMAAATDRDGLRLIGHSSLAGIGDAMQVIKRGDHAYVAHVGASPLRLTVLDVSDPSAPVVVRQIPRPANTHGHKVQVAGGLLLQNSEARPQHLRVGDADPVTGLIVCDLSDPEDPREIGFHPAVGTGVHRIWFEEPPYAHIASWVPGIATRTYEIVDLSDPSRPRRVGLWWIPGSAPGDDEQWFRPEDIYTEARGGRRFPVVGVHGAIPAGDRAYASCLDLGFVLLDISDRSRPQVLGRANWCPPYGGYLHTSLPLPRRGLVVCATEALRNTLREEEGDKRVWLVDVRDERRPVPISSLPWPKPPRSSGVSSYWDLPGNCGPHNLHENRPGSFQSDTILFATWNNAGLRVFDTRDRFAPSEIAHFVPPGAPHVASNDLFVDQDRTVYLTDRLGGGLYVLEYTGPL